MCYAQKVAFTIHEPDLIPEGICHDAFRNRFLLTSLAKNKIVVVSKGTTSDFISSQQAGFEGGLGIKADGKRNFLWACSGSVQGKNYSTGIYVFDLLSGREVKKFQVKSDNNQTFFNDLAIDQNRGDVYITNTFDHSIWKWSLGDDAPVKLKLEKPIAYPNGIAFLSTSTLVIAGSDGLYTLNFQTMEQRLLGVPADATSPLSLDGIVVYNNTIIGVSNVSSKKSDHAIIQFALSPDQRKIIHSRIIDQNNPSFDIPTTMTLFGDQLYVIANSRSKQKDTVVLQYDLK